jgi:hypothetical protein
MTQKASTVAANPDKTRLGLMSRRTLDIAVPELGKR